MFIIDVRTHGAFAVYVLHLRFSKLPTVCVHACARRPAVYYDSSGEFKEIDSANNVTIKFGIDGRPNEGWIIRIKNEDIDSYIDIDIDAISGGVQIIDED